MPAAPPALATSDPGSFAMRTITERKPRIIQQVIDTNSLSGRGREGLQGLAVEMRDGAVSDTFQALKDEELAGPRGALALSRRIVRALEGIEPVGAGRIDMILDNACSELAFDLLLATQLLSGKQPAAGGRAITLHVKRSPFSVSDAMEKEGRATTEAFSSHGDAPLGRRGLVRLCRPGRRGS